MAEAVLFSGQGSQCVGMGRSYYENAEEMRDVFALAQKILGYDLAAICFDGPQEKLTPTDSCQVALFVVGYGIFRVLQRQKKLADLRTCLGLSLGEWTALTAAGAIDFEVALPLVAKRGILMQRACENTSGAMVSLLGSTPEIVASICNRADVEASNFNSPGQIVISGEKNKIQNAMELAANEGVKRMMPLQVAGAYHSRLMASARDAFAHELARVSFRSPRHRVISNVTGREVSDPEEIRRLLVQQITAPVRWEQCMQRAWECGADTFFECGPGKVLTGLVRKNCPDAVAISAAEFAD